LRIRRFAILDDSTEGFQAGWPKLIVCDSQPGIDDMAVLAATRRFVSLDDEMQGI
jgi:hypothetical protein